ncbi:MAG: trypsin-like peptidase domain-containing protein [Verrucomicrobia bacterium]|nr:trypsin-like peptidase domain-containing protein [Verrucomicrobiota bacterium]
MFVRIVLLSAFLTGEALSTLGGDVLQLKDQVSINGRILAEKPDQVAVDVGYTVLVVPRNQIVSITRSEAEKTPKEDNQVSSTPSNELNSPLFHAAGSSRSERSVRELVKVLGESVVQVRTPSGLGSGFILNEDGYLITNFHVIEGETQISVEVYHQNGGQFERKSYKEVRIVAMNKFEDLALLRIDEKGAPKFSYVTLGDSDAVAVGDRVFAIGSPLGLERTVTEGILSTKTRQLQGELYLQTTAQINPGNSGGPLFNLRGEVIGVTNMKMTFGEGLGFAIPVEAVKYFLGHRDAFAYDNDNPSSPYRYLEPPSRVKKSIPDE